ncbi:MAG: hypothetical protein GY950_26425 [bacterium]|nr:hypothetical protein [bacterium]
MNRWRIFFPVLVLVSLITCCISCQIKKTISQPQPSSAPCETRGTWLWASSFDTPEKRTVALDSIAQGNLNTVFVSIPPIGGNFGYGSPEDFLAFIKEAKNQGLSLHGWMSNGRRNGRNNTIDFRDAGEQDAQVVWVLDLLVRYGDYLDGVHLDYIRPMYGGAVNRDGIMDGVTATVRKIYDNLKYSYPGKYLSAACFRETPVKEESYRDPPLWVEDVPQWFRDWYADHPGSIYHGPDYVCVPKHLKWGQNPVSWLNEPIMSAVMPMQYTINDDVWNQTVDTFKSFNQYVGNKPETAYVGLGWVPQSDDAPDRGCDPPGVVRKIKYGRSIGMKGFVIFILCNHGFDDSPLLKALSEDSEANGYDAPYKTAVPSCLKE